MNNKSGRAIYQVSSHPTWTAFFTLGLRKGLGGKGVGLSLVRIKQLLSSAQTELKETAGLILSASVSRVAIVCEGQDEPHAEIAFIRYPRFPAEPEALKQGVLFLMERLMRETGQHRCVAVFPGETVMLQKDDRVDPGIRA